MIGEHLLSVAESLLAEMSAKRGFRVQPFVQTVEPVADVAGHRRAFQLAFEDGVRRLTTVYGPVSGASAMREAGFDPEVLLSHPATSATDSDLKRVAAWRAGLQWLLLAGRHYCKGHTCWSLVLIGGGGLGGAPVDEMATRKLA